MTRGYLYARARQPMKKLLLRVRIDAVPFLLIVSPVILLICIMYILAYVTEKLSEVLKAAGDSLMFIFAYAPEKKVNRYFRLLRKFKGYHPTSK